MGNTTKEKRKELEWVISELGYDQVDTVISSWKFRHKAGDEATVRDMLEEMVAKKRIWGIFASSSSLVAWVTLYSYGCLGMLHTREEYRRQGFATRLISSACKEVRKKLGLTPLVLIEDNNTASINFFLQLGFSQLEE